MPIRKRPDFSSSQKNVSTSGKRKVNVEVIPVKLQLPQAHPAQHEFISFFDKNPQARFLFGAAGTKWGRWSPSLRLSPLTGTSGSCKTKLLDALQGSF